MDELGEKKAEHSSEESSDHRHKCNNDDVAAVPEGVHGESTNQRDEADETAGVIKEQVEVVEEQASALLAHPCLLLLLLLRACAGFLVGLQLHGYCSHDDDDDDGTAAAAVTESSPQEGEGGDDDDDKAAGNEVVTHQVVLLLPPPPPGPPEEGSGGHGGSHN